MKLFNKLALFCCVAALVAAPAIYVTAQAADAPAKAEKPKKKAPIELNNATSEQLQTLKGIDAAIAREIIKNRPFSSITQLVSKNIISKEVYDEIKKEIKTGKYTEPPAKKGKGKGQGKGKGKGK